MDHIFSGKRYQDALQFASHAHRKQMRKGSDVPYIIHPIECSMIVASITEDEDVIIAALLHDVIEDTDYGYEDIKNRYGKRVADLVQNETENKRNDQSRESTWVIRKQETIDHIEKADYETKLICLGDKLSNIRASVRDYESDRNSFWNRFNQSDPKFQGWYYQTLRDILKKDFSESEAWKEYDELCRRLFGDLDLREIEKKISD